MEVRRQFHHISKCGIGGWCILSLVGGGFWGDPGLLYKIDLTVHVVDLVEHYPS